jgi:hypothetical protein
MDNIQLAQALRDLFQGFENGHGTYNPKVTNTAGKLVGHAEFIHEPATLTTWINHIEGTIGVGMGPINNNSECLWGAIDIDDYSVNHLKLITKIQQLNLPLIVVKSKSGGAHLMMFLSEWAPADLVKKRLEEMATILGHSHNKEGRPTEIFPRQTKILSERGDTGNWLNIPYFGGDDSSRYALDTNAERISIKDFLDLASKKKLSTQQLSALEIIQKNTKKNPEFKDTPVCLGLIMEEGGVYEGGRNTFMYNMGVYASKIHPYNKELRNALMEEWNNKYCNPPLNAKEMCILQSTFDKHPDYKYQCKEGLLKSYCNVTLCKARKHGLSSACNLPSICDLTKLEGPPSLYFLQINDTRIELDSTETLLNQTRFQVQCMEQANIVVPTQKKAEWEALIASLTEDMRIIEAPPDTSLEAKLEELLETFAEQINAGFDREDITRGLPWLDTKTGKIVFKLSAFENYLQNNKFNKFNRTQLVSKLKSWGGENKMAKIKGKNHNVWYITMDNISSQAYEIRLKTERDIL